MSGPANEKDAMRARLRAAREQRSDDERERAGNLIAEHGGDLLRSLSRDMPLLVAAYLSLPTEPSTDALIARAHADLDAVWVPRVEDEELAWAAYRPSTPIQTGRFGIREPVGPAVRPGDLVGLDVLFVPGLAVDARGHRLGQGGGYFDRVLATLPRNIDGGPLVAIVLFDDEVLPHVPVEEHDRPVDVALTPSGITDLG